MGEGMGTIGRRLAEGEKKESEAETVSRASARLKGVPRMRLSHIFSCKLLSASLRIVCGPAGFLGAACVSHQA